MSKKLEIQIRVVERAIANYTNLVREYEHILANEDLILGSMLIEPLKKFLNECSSAKINTITSVTLARVIIGEYTPRRKTIFQGYIKVQHFEMDESGLELDKVNEQVKDFHLFARSISVVIGQHKKNR